jgi:hypothetical protein
MNPKQFWDQLQGTIAVYDAVASRKAEHNTKTKNQQKRIDITSKILDLEYQTGLEIVMSSTNKYHNLFAQLFIDMSKAEFKKTESVSQSFDVHLLSYNNRYKLLTEIDLYSHTMNVVVETIKITKDIPQDTKNIAILLALLHDFGKSKLISDEYRFEAKAKGKHHIISANYAKYTMQSEKLSYLSKEEITNELIELVYEVLRNHHEENIVNKNIFFKLLEKADANAREIELNGILLKQKRKAKQKLDKENNK